MRMLVGVLYIQIYCKDENRRMLGMLIQNQIHTHTYIYIYSLEAMTNFIFPWEGEGWYVMLMYNSVLISCSFRARFHCTMMKIVYLLLVWCLGLFLNHTR